MRHSDFLELIKEYAAKRRALAANVHRTVVDRDRDERSRRAWENACDAFHSQASKLDSYFERAWSEERYTDSDVLEFVVCFLEADPWFFRSGYLKQIFLTRLKRSDLNEPLKKRLRNVLVDAVQRRGTREFRHYCRLAVMLADQELLSQLEAARSDADSARAHRAKMMLETIRNQR